MAKNYFSETLFGAKDANPWATNQWNKLNYGLPTDAKYFIDQGGPHGNLMEGITLPQGNFILVRGEGDAYSSIGNPNPKMIRSNDSYKHVNMQDDVGYMFDVGSYIISPVGASVKPPAGSGVSYSSEHRGTALANSLANLSNQYLQPYLVDQDVMPAYGDWLSGAESGGAVNMVDNQHPIFRISEDYGGMRGLYFDDFGLVLRGSSAAVPDIRPSLSEVSQKFPYSIVMGKTPLLKGDDFVHKIDTQPNIHAVYGGRPVVTHPSQIVDKVAAVFYPPTAPGPWSDTRHAWGRHASYPKDPTGDYNNWMESLGDLSLPLRR